MFHEPTPEQIEQFEEEAERAEAYNEMMTQRVRRLFAEELTKDQLDVMRLVFDHIGNSQVPVAVSQWYSGIVYGAIAVRDIVLGEGEEPEAL